MAVFVPPGFWQFILSLNDEEAEEFTKVVDASRTITRATLNALDPSPGLMRMDPVLRPSKKKKRKVSKYQREFGRQLKKLKRKHPRTPSTRLMKRAHAATKRAMKKR